MIEHPGTELQVLIKEKGLTQKAFALILGKKVSEVNELLKGKRNITIQRDYLLHQTLGTPIKYWILKQVDYDYSLIDIEEEPVSSGAIAKDLRGDANESNAQDSSSQAPQNDNNSVSSGAIAKDLKRETSESNTQDSSSQAPQNDNNSVSSGAIAKDLMGDTNESNAQDSSSLHPTEGQDKDDEDFKKRAKIFKSF